MIQIEAHIQTRPLNRVFRISRGAKTEAQSVMVSLRHQGFEGRGEAIPYARYNESVEGELAKINAARFALDDDLREIMPASAARNALDCALWDLRAKIAGKSVASLLNQPLPKEVRTAQTLSLDTPKTMAIEASALGAQALIKVKLGGEGDLERMRAIRAANPSADLIVDANEGWSLEDYNQLVPEFQTLNVQMIEQPFPQGEDEILKSLKRPIPICADESLHIAKDAEKLAAFYDIYNIKLDKSGGLSEALKIKAEAARLQKPYMIGCMVGSSLAMAPAYLLASDARFVDLDGAMFVADDETPAIQYQNGMMQAPSPELWG